MPKTLLVVGDSFMTQDARFPGSHWSEKLPGLSVINSARTGASNAMIFRQLVTNLDRADAVVIGMTNSQRLELDITKCDKKFYPGDMSWDYVTMAQEFHFSDSQKQFKKYYLDLTDLKICVETAVLNLIGMVNTCLSCNKEVVFSLGLLDREFEYIQIPWIKDWLQRMSRHNLNFNLADYPELKSDPAFPLYHVDSDEWQFQFAQRVLAKFT